jgi:hypothetical protein
MKNTRVIALVLGLVAVALGVGLFLSNALRGTAEARFTKGENGLVDLHVRGPSGLRCITYSVVPGPGGKPTLGGRGSTTLPLFGDHVESSNAFPASGEVLAIAPEQHVRLSATYDPSAAIEPARPGTDDRYGLFLLVTRDPTWFDRLATDAPALAASPAPAQPPAMAPR